MRQAQVEILTPLSIDLPRSHPARRTRTHRVEGRGDGLRRAPSVRTADIRGPRTGADRHPRRQRFWQDHLVPPAHRRTETCERRHRPPHRPHCRARSAHRPARSRLEHSRQSAPPQSRALGQRGLMPRWRRFAFRNRAALQIAARSAAASGCARRSPARSPRPQPPFLCCWTSRPTISISPRSRSLENALKGSDGALIVVSHDETFFADDRDRKGDRCFSAQRSDRRLVRLSPAPAMRRNSSNATAPSATCVTSATVDEELRVMVEDVRR